MTDTVQIQININKATFYDLERLAAKEDGDVEPYIIRTLKRHIRGQKFNGRL